ncbi:MAG: SDR family NAD(P)-dependent oxidoreductase [SAR202 cluster bacterium]|nr:SDR family NAD(P)-dependent oxidoreductase [SAR202 cluster bacterium]MDP6714834.1 SDR family NAD(P)-dependent oxidoreductase [SAR202 cluster bacterium]
MTTSEAEFNDKIAIVTGAGRGMGRAVAHRLAAGGAKLVVNDVATDSAEGVASELRSLGAEAIAAPGDVSNSADVKDMVDAAIENFGALHILVNNAGILRPTAVIDIEEDEWDLVVSVNLRGTYLCSRAALPSMREAGWGRIVNFSSTAGKNVSTVGGAHYTAAKAGILGFTRHLAKEEAGYGITVNSVCPGLIDTEMVRATIDPDLTKTYAASFPIPRLGEPEEVAELVAFLASDRAAYITGASLDINGGDLMI